MDDRGSLFDDRVAARYEAWYDTGEGRRADAQEKAALEEALRTFRDIGSMLEIGCGTGHFTRWLDEGGRQAVGLDIAASMLAEAQKQDGVPLVQGDARRLPFADHAFDATLMIATLEFLESPQLALAEAARVSRQGVVLGVLNRCSLLALRRRLKGLFQPTIYDEARFYSLGELARLLRAVADTESRVSWTTALFPSWWPWQETRLPLGGFIAVALYCPDQHEKTDEARQEASAAGGNEGDPSLGFN